MTFTSFEFALFLPIVFILYWYVFNKNAKTQNVLLLIASIIFYSMADWKFISLLAASGFFNFYLAKLIAWREESKIRGLFFYTGIVFNIGILFYFKYFNFFVLSFISLFNYSGFNTDFTAFHILLPLGISFFTFQMIGYLIDVNNEEIQPNDDLLCFFTYLIYFPKILSGPIERAQRFLPQLMKKRDFDYLMAVDGLRQILWGLFKKMIIADRLTPVVNNIFDNYQNLTGSTLLLGAIFYMISIYADFSGYSDIACGVSKLFSIRITNNFAFPFFSVNISDFWKKWHISLTSWMMDYVFTPLNFVLRGYKKIGLVISIVITFLIVGLWHGANWTFVAFGFMHGLYFVPLILKNALNKGKIIAAGRLVPSASECLRMLGILFLTSITSIIIRSDNIGQALGYLSKVLSISLFSEPTFVGMQSVPTTVIFIVISIFIEWTGRERDHAIAHIGEKWNRPLRSMFYFAIVLTLFWFGGREQQFIYFQF